MKPPWKHFAVPTAICAGAAVAGVLGTKVDSRWYKGLRKPAWQPPGWVFGPAWTTLYSLTAIASGRVLDRLPDHRSRTGFTGELATNMTLNVAWSWLFFTAQRPRASLIDSAALEVSTLRLMKKAAEVDRTSALMLAPYAGWVGFATVLNGEIIRLNPARTAKH
ncbi:TspO/MBR related protein [Brevibacterium sanguinis]|uniref:TspO/MBR related protein n=2 Tax=Brevibacterium TaxID=1696 RepID=A0A366IGU0_9MICO|nr:MULTISPECIES: TspO/MBR family protein [Brevibacterium]RBP62953.1 TspO/MBR related protein [Brevibacterium sanguinis]RBP69502.1 TspO/MBR related protein [Brevibacterium celere]